MIIWNSISVSISKFYWKMLQFIYELSVFAFTLQWWSWIVATETIYGALHVTPCTANHNDAVITAFPVLPYCNFSVFILLYFSLVYLILSVHTNHDKIRVEERSGLCMMCL